MVEQPVDGGVPVAHGVREVVHVPEARVDARKVDVALEEGWVAALPRLLPELPASGKS